MMTPATEEPTSDVAAVEEGVAGPTSVTQPTAEPTVTPAAEPPVEPSPPPPPPPPCHVCGSAEFDPEEDEILQCSSCGVAVHQGCYGVAAVVPDWQCASCAAGLLGHRAPPCQLCPVKGGAMKRVITGGWAHVACALWIDTTYMKHPSLMEPIAGVNRVPAAQRTCTCAYCGRKEGVCIRCALPGCRVMFHLLCAREQQCISLFDDNGDTLAFCTEHSGPSFAKLRARLQAGEVLPHKDDVFRRPPPTPEEIQQMQDAFRRRRAAFLEKHWHLFAPFLAKEEDRDVRGPLATRIIRRYMGEADSDSEDTAEPAKTTATAEPEPMATESTTTTTTATPAADAVVVSDTAMTDAPAPAATVAPAAAPVATKTAGKRKRETTAAPKRTRAPVPVTGQPMLVVGGEMRDYQIEGVRWMVGQHDAGASSILGDEMGLGKTCQVISFLAFLHQERREPGPHLIVAPLSVMPTWTGELQRWVPAFRVITFHGPEMERARLKTMMRPGEFDIVVTTYEMLLAERDMFTKRKKWTYVVLDEAQRIKNESSLVGQAVQQLHSVGRLLLTGTPLQNNLHELWALLHFLYPEVFTSSSVFDAGFVMDDGSGSGRPTIDREVISAAHALLQPLMLRRLKSTVLTLPPKTETKVYVPMSNMQTHFYKGLLELNAGILTGDGSSEAQGSMRWQKLSNLLMQLRKCCDHPFLFPDADANLGMTDESIVTVSGKMQVLDKLLFRLQKEGHKCLIYSQFTRMLDILQDYCEFRGFKYLRLDGQTAIARRRYEMALFNSPKSSHFIYLISTRAGGLGLNLQTADTIIMYDSDWNPQMDKQAQDRVHRIGQKRPVHVYRFVGKGTCEERILHFAETKLALGQMVLRDQTGDSPEDNANLDAGELLKIIRFGSAAVVAGTHATEDAAKLDIDAILSASKAYEQSKQEQQQDKQKASPTKVEAGSESPTSSLESEDPPAEAVDIRTFDGVKYTKTGSIRSLADEWIAQIGDKKRVSQPTVEAVPLGRSGRRTIPVSKWSIAQAEKEKADAQRIAAMAAAAKAPKPKAPHETLCIACKLPEGAVVPKDPTYRPTVAMRKHANVMLECSHCPRVMHVACARLKQLPKANWSCVQHRCTACDRNAADAGGLLFRCITCPHAYCDECLVDGFEPEERCEAFEALNFIPPRTYEYIRCIDCVFESQFAAEIRAEQARKQREKEAAERAAAIAKKAAEEERLAAEEALRSPKRVKTDLDLEEAPPSSGRRSSLRQRR